MATSKLIMINFLKLLVVFICLFFMKGNVLISQEISGHVLNEVKLPFANAKISVLQKGALFASVYTDTNGFYIVGAQPGFYDVLATYEGFDSMIISQVMVSKDMRINVNFLMQKHDMHPDPRKRKNVCTFSHNYRETDEWEQFFIIDQIKHLPK